MVPFLLILLLLPLSLADQVCINFTDHYNMEINADNVATVVEKLDAGVKCRAHADMACLFLCTLKDMFNESYGCLNVTLNVNDNKTNNKQENNNCTLYLCNAKNILPLIRSLDNDDSLQREMSLLIYILNTCVELFNIDDEVKKRYTKAEKHIILNIIRKSKFLNGNLINYNLSAFSMNVEKIKATDLSSQGSGYIKAKVPLLPPLYDSYVVENWLPVGCLQSVPDEERIFGLVSYMQQKHFEVKQREIPSMVYRIELLSGERLHNLTVPINITFKVPPHKYADNDNIACHYLDEDAWQWKRDGCTTHNSSQSDIICSCNHTTAFAVLLIQTDDISKIHWQILSYISYIGCGLSAFFTALSIIFYIFVRGSKNDYSIYIHASLSGALFLLNSTFLLTEWGATVELDWVCIFIAAFMHFSLLCSFTWMAIEALHLYLMLIKVFNTNYRHYRLKLSIFGWGFPGIIVAVSVAVKDAKQFYGVTHMSMADTNQTNAICWITDSTFFYSMNLVYFIFIFIFNFGILMAVASSISKMHQESNRHSKLGSQSGGHAQRYTDKLSGSCRSGLTVLGLTCLMGTSWGLAFLGSGFVNYPILYLFCILNSTQGFFIFLWICLSMRRQRMQAMRDRTTANTVQSSNTKSD